MALPELAGHRRIWVIDDEKESASGTDAHEIEGLEMIGILVRRSPRPWGSTSQISSTCRIQKRERTVYRQEAAKEGGRDVVNHNSIYTLFW